MKIPKKVPKTNVSGDEIIIVLQDQLIPESNISGISLFKSAKVDKDFIDIEMAEGDTPEECFDNLTTEPFSFDDFRNYGGEKDSDSGIYFKSILNNEGFDYLTNWEGNSIPFIQLIGNPNTVLSYINSNGVPYVGSVSEGLGEYINKLLNVKVGCDYIDDITSIEGYSVDFKIEVYPFHGFDYDTNMTLYYEGDNVIDNPIRWIGYVPGGVLAVSGIAVIGGTILAAINVNAFNVLQQAILNMAGGPFDKVVATIDKLFPSLNDAIESFYNPSTGYSNITATGGTVLAEALISFAFLMGCLAITETIIRIVNPDAFVNNDIDEGYKLYNISTGGVYNNLDVANSMVAITTGKKTDITSNKFEGTASQVKVDCGEYSMYANSFFTGNIIDDLFVPFNESTYQNNTGITVYTNGIGITSGIIVSNEQLIKNGTSVEDIIISNYGNLVLNNSANYLIKILIYNDDGNGSYTLGASSNITTIISQPNSNSSGELSFYCKPINNSLTIGVQLSAPFKGKIYDIRVYSIPDVFPYDNYNSVGVTNYTNHINVKIDPKGVKYDMITPPPATSYLVKLVPLNDSKLSTTKPTSFIVTCIPDTQPDFDFDITPKTIYSNTLVTLKNAKHCDFVVFRDLKKTTFLGFFPKLYNFWVNSNGNDGVSLAVRGGLFSGYNGSDITGINKKMIAKYENYDNNEEYDVIFAMEAHSRCPELIFNRYFINRVVDNGFVNSLIPKYWELDNFYISGGACHKNDTNASGSIIQQMPSMEESMNWKALYRVRIDVTSHNGELLYIDLDNTFVDGIYWISSDDMKDPDRYPLEIETNEFEGSLNGAYISEDDIKCILPNTGIYDIALRAVSSSSLDKSIRIMADTAFTGSISYVHVRRMSYLKDLNDRVIPLATKKIRFRKGYDSQQIYLYFATYLSGTSISITIGDVFNAFKPDEVGSPDRYTVIDWGDGIIEEYSNIQEGVYGTATHTYDTNTKLYMITLYPSRSYEAIGYLQCNNKGLVHFMVNDIGLQDIELNLNDSNLGYVDNYLNQLFKEGAILATNESQSTKILTSIRGAIKIRLQNNTSLECNINNLLGLIEYLDIHNTKIYGDVKDLNDITEYFNISNTRISSYVGHPFTKCIYNEWENVTPVMSEDSLNNLVRACYESSIDNGTLYIKGNNPNITDVIILSYIDNLIIRNWNLRYNKITDITFTFTVVPNPSLTLILGFQDVGCLISIDYGDGTIVVNQPCNWGDIGYNETHTYSSITEYNVIVTVSNYNLLYWISLIGQCKVKNLDFKELTTITSLGLVLDDNVVVNTSNFINLENISLVGNTPILDTTNNVNIGNIICSDCNIGQISIDSLLYNLDTNGVVGGYANFSGNASPSVTGWIYVDNLRNKGWEVVVESLNPTITLSGKTYQSVQIGDLYVLTELLEVETSNFKYPNGSSDNKEQYGLLYMLDSVSELNLSDGWRLPTIAEVLLINPVISPLKDINIYPSSGVYLKVSVNEHFIYENYSFFNSSGVDAAFYYLPSDYYTYSSNQQTLAICSMYNGQSVASVYSSSLTGFGGVPTLLYGSILLVKDV